MKRQNIKSNNKLFKLTQSILPFLRENGNAMALSYPVAKQQTKGYL